MTRHGEMDSETLLHIDSDSCNSQARSGLSPGSSFHFLTWEKERQPETELETCPDRSLYSVLTCSPLAESIIFGLNVPSGSKGQKLLQRKARAGSDWTRLWYWSVKEWSLLPLPNHVSGKEKKETKKQQKMQQLYQLCAISGFPGLQTEVPLTRHRSPHWSIYQRVILHVVESKSGTDSEFMGLRSAIWQRK